ncbi:PTS transporter subunit EIIA, partial [Streptomyces sp. SID7499]|nr:PTS transporter subunit EIIA [Streptomyces sp. SID7499]
DLIFLIAAPAGADDDHLTILSGLARRLMDPEFTAALRAGTDPRAVAALIRGEEPPEEPEQARVETGNQEQERAGTGAEAAGATGAAGSVPFRIVAVTSCPTGIAHTYMAAESLAAAGRAEGVEVTVETQGSAGFKKLDPAVVAAADAVIWAHDVEVREKARFRGKPLVDVGVKAGINRPAELIAEARRKA